MQHNQRRTCHVYSWNKLSARGRPRTFQWTAGTIVFGPSPVARLWRRCRETLLTHHRAICRSNQGTAESLNVFSLSNILEKRDEW